MTSPTLLFVHGAWHGAWCWDAVTGLLADRGWNVRAVNLPTVHAQERKAAMGMLDDAATVRDEIEAIDGPVVVVAHSYGGVPAGEGADDPSVARIIYVASFAIPAGQSLIEAAGGTPPPWWNIQGDLYTPGNDEHSPIDLFYGDVEPEAARAAAARIQPMSLKSATQATTTAAWQNRPTTYIVAEQDGAIPPVVQHAMAEAIGADKVSIDTSHSPFLSQPEQLADLIESAARA